MGRVILLCLKTEDAEIEQSTQGHQNGGIDTVVDTAMIQLQRLLIYESDEPICNKFFGGLLAYG